MTTVVKDFVKFLVAGETIAVNDAVRINPANGRVQKFNVNDASHVFAGIAKTSANNNGDIKIVQAGRIKGFSGLTPGAFVYASVTNPGKFQLTEPPSFQRVVLGIANSATELTLNGSLGIKTGGDGGSGGGGLDVFYTEDMESLISITSFSRGNNASFLGGGTLQGTLAVESVSPISGLKSLKYTQAAGSLNDYFASPVINLDPKQRGNFSKMVFYYTYNGAPADVRVVVYDVTNGAEISTSPLNLQSPTLATRYSFVVEIPSNCLEIRYGFQVQSENIGKILVIDDIELKLGDIFPTSDYSAFTKLDSSTPCLVKSGASTLTLKGGTSATVGGVRVDFNSDTPVIMPSLTGGTDYAVYICDDNTVRASDNFLAPSGYSPSTSKKIGGFHYGLVSPTETVATGGFATSGNGMIWTQSDVDRIKGINEFSIWDIKFRPKANDPRGMALVANQFWVDIYFTNTNHEVNGTSKAGTDIASGTVLPKIPTMWGRDGTTTYASGTWWNFSDIAKAHGKRLMNFQEFSAAAFGVTEARSLGGGSYTPPLTKREPGFTSKWGLEQASGHLWSWGAEISGATGSATWKSNTEGRGSTYANNLSAPLYGGFRSEGAFSGSRASYWGYSPWYTSFYFGLRAACDHLLLE